MDRYRVTLAGIRKHSRLLDIASEGCAPDEIRDLCRQTLAQVLEDPTAVEDLSIDMLFAETKCVVRAVMEPWSSGFLRYCLELRRQAYATAGDAAIEEAVRWQSAINRGIGQYWSLIQLERPKDDLALEDFVVEAFRNIGGLLEATTLPYLRELSGQLRLSLGLAPANGDQPEFGKVIASLSTDDWLAKLMAPEPWEVPLNQWRNIAQHHSFDVKGEIIEVRYGRGVNPHELHLSRDDLWAVLRLIFSVHNIVKTAHTLFFLDHRAEFAGRMPKFTERPDTAISNFAIRSASQGFETTEVETRPEFARAVLRDVTDKSVWERQFHASQFVVQLWIATNSLECELIYEQRDGTPTLSTVATAADCRAVVDGQIDLGELSQRVTFNVLSRCEPPEGWERGNTPKDCPGAVE